MKKAVVIFYKLFIISIVCQVLFYLFINNVFLGNNGKIAETFKIIDKSSSGKEKLDVNIEIPKDASQLKISFDESYVSYLSDGKLKIVDLSTKKVKKTIENVFLDAEKLQGNITCYSWLPDKNIIMYVLSTPKNLPGRIQVFSYDVDSDNEHIGAKLAGDNLLRGSEGTDLVISPLNMITYLKIKTSSTGARIYRINLMDEVSEPMKVDLNSIFKIGYYNENLVLQDEQNKIFVRNKSGIMNQIQLNKKTILLEVTGISKDGKDMAYIGELEKNKKVSKIIYGVIGTNISKWSNKQLERSSLPEDIIIKNNGNIYEISETENVLYNLSENSKTKFKGSFIDIFGDQVFYLDNNVLKSKIF